eukprot:CAMPEP_0201898224 /NCGR_PEP_ID=MMETSP0902-20130614/48111_1 /ASSEMBLY_ACC=CAM_ASM_000551 /TAXON_ID=420261 /ORGANISM="Thalassiosira antarctica, Strain CCMP982" /LENGTH=82 /DNA_ID=CAMNT_0048431317 /DNA_START=649 /DNA_END=894 /DNA_ORIENTATION=-
MKRGEKDGILATEERIAKPKKATGCLASRSGTCEPVLSKCCFKGAMNPANAVNDLHNQLKKTDSNSSPSTYLKEHRRKYQHL